MIGTGRGFAYFYLLLNLIFSVWRILRFCVEKSPGVWLLEMWWCWKRERVLRERGRWERGWWERGCWERERECWEREGVEREDVEREGVEREGVEREGVERKRVLRERVLREREREGERKRERNRKVYMDWRGLGSQSVRCCMSCLPDFISCCYFG